MDIHVDKEPGALVLKPEGRIDGQNAQDFHTALESALTGNTDAVILDMQDIAYISSAGLRVILLIAKAMRQQEVQFVLCSLVGAVKQVFTISGFQKFLPIHDSRVDAVAAVGG